MTSLSNAEIVKRTCGAYCSCSLHGPLEDPQVAMCRDCDIRRDVGAALDAKDAEIAEAIEEKDIARRLYHEHVTDCSWRPRAEKVEATVAAQAARIGELTEALRPFAKIGEEFSDPRLLNGVPAGPEYHWATGKDLPEFTVGDFRRAAAALATADAENARTTLGDNVAIVNASAPEGKVASALGVMLAAAGTGKPSPAAAEPCGTCGGRGELLEGVEPPEMREVWERCPACSSPPDRDDATPTPTEVAASIQRDIEDGLALPPKPCSASIVVSGNIMIRGGGGISIDDVTGIVIEDNHIDPCGWRESEDDK